MIADWSILQGHVLDVLRSLPSESVHCVITSPPYYGLRTYSISEQVWGGEEDCDHQWGDDLRLDTSRGTSRSPIQKPASDARGSCRGAFCQICDAWRGELGLEPSIEMYIAHIVLVFREVWRVLRKDGTLWLNIGDSYVSGPTGHQSIHKARGTATKMFAKGGRYRVDNMRKDVAAARKHSGLKPKDLCLIPFRLAPALQAGGWYVRMDNIWSKSNPMPESVTDRPTRSHEYVFLLSKSKRYFYDQDAIREPLSDKTFTTFGTTRKTQDDRDPLIKSHNWSGIERQPRLDTDGKFAGANKRSVWTIASSPFPEAHFATFPTKLVEPCVLAGTSERGACGQCGAPWRRVVERSGGNYSDRKARGVGGPYTPELRRGNMGDLGSVSVSVGWEPGCKCDGTGDPVPCTVLDPFSGAGTTVLVAVRHGRRGLGIELNPDYIAISERRIRKDAPLFEARAESLHDVHEQHSFLDITATEEVA